MFRIVALVGEQHLGRIMRTLLTAGAEIAECKLAVVADTEPKTVRPPRKHPRTRPGGTMDKVLAEIPAIDSIHRKELKFLLPDMSRSAVDGALSKLTAKGTLIRVGIGLYARPVEHKPGGVTPMDEAIKALLP